jgi:predicted site-specific integrase-resolvase
MDKLRYDSADVLEITGWSQGYLNMICSQGRIKYTRPTGGRRFFKKEDIEAFYDNLHPINKD